MGGAYLLTNHAVSELASGITDSATSLTVASGEGNLFPASRFKIIVGNEIILVGSRTTDTFSSLTRGYEGTTAAAHLAADAVTHLFTAEDYLTTPRNSLLDRIYRRPSDETPHSADDEFDGSSSVSWSEYTVSGTATWNEDSAKSVLTVYNASQSAGDAAIRTQAVGALSHPLTIETRQFQDLYDNDYLMTGPIFTNGETSTSLSFVCMPFLWNGGGAVRLSVRSGQLDNLGASDLYVRDHHVNEWLWWRLIWSAANSFKAQWSIDGSVWHTTGPHSYTMTPTRMGLNVSTWAGTATRFSTFDYFRVYESDLSL